MTGHQPLIIIDYYYSAFIGRILFFAAVISYNVNIIIIQD
jgi:hypothetical protein